MVTLKRGLFLGAAALLLSGCWGTSSSQKRSEKVVVLTYSSFASEWGPGQELKKLFEKANPKVELEFLKAEDANLLLKKAVALNRAGHRVVDIIMGLDNLTYEKALKELPWAKIPKSTQEVFPILVSSEAVESLVPFDWAPLAFVTRKSSFPDSKYPKNLKELMELPKTLALQDPRTSSPGLQLLNWLESSSHFPFPTGLSQLLNERTQISPSWSGAYQLFTDKKVDVVFSYLTSPVYHWMNESNKDIVALTFDEPHPVQVEYMGIVATCPNCKMAQKVISFFQSPEAQKVIMNKNYMFPILPSVVLGSPFETLKMPQVKQLENKERLIKVWDRIRKTK